MTSRLAQVAVLVLATTTACGDDGPSPPLDDLGTQASFDLDADWTQPASFYDFPFPSDLRLTTDGVADWRGFPATAASDIFATVFDALAVRPGFAMQPVAYFRFNAQMDPLDADAPIAADVASPVLLMDTDPSSPQRGKLYPTTARVHAPDEYNPENLLAVGAYPGVVLHGDRTYAFVVKRTLNDAAGAPLGVPPVLTTLASRETPPGDRGAAAAELYAPLWDTLHILDIEPGEVAAATVFTVGDVVRQNLEQSDGVLAAHDVTIDDVALDPDDGATHARFCELHATIDMPFFQKGVSPFNDKGEAVMDYDADGVPVQVTTETVQLAIAIPKSEMPAGGYPLLLYIHGSGGVSTQAIDRGTITTTGGEATKGEGPAHVVAEHGIATIGASMPFSPDRNPDAGSFDYLSQVNFSAAPFNFRQGMFEQRLLLEAMATFTVDPATLATCDGPTLPAGETMFHFNTDDVALMGQSMGAAYANLVAAVEPRIKAMMPSGSGSFFGKFLMVSPFYGGVKRIVGAILNTSADNLSYLHPGVFAVHSAWEPGDALPSLPRINQRPFDGHAAREFFTVAAEGDEFFPTEVFNAMALGMGSQQAGTPTWSSLQDDMKLVGTDGLASYPVVHNRDNAAGDSFTSVVLQYEGDGIANPHTIFSQLDEVKYQYGCFFASYFATGTATLPEPAALGTPCP